MIAIIVYSSDNKGILPPEILFPAISLFGLLRIPLILLPMVISQYIDTKVALNRIQSLLTGEENNFKPLVDTNMEHGIVAEDCEFDWTSLKKKEDLKKEKEEQHKKEIEEAKKNGVKMGKNTFPLEQFKDEIKVTSSLKNVNLKIPKGKLTAIVG
jgi:ABC-type multidrug transport system fused ATPase/permease subunit